MADRIEKKKKKKKMSAASADTVLYRTSTLGTSNNNQLYIIGRESRDTSARYQIPVIYLRFPYRCSQRPRTRSMVICLLPNDKEYVVLPFEFSRSEIRANPVPDIAPRAPPPQGRTLADIFQPPLDLLQLLLSYNSEIHDVDQQGISFFDDPGYFTSLSNCTAYASVGVRYKWPLIHCGLFARAMVTMH